MMAKLKHLLTVFFFLTQLCAYAQVYKMQYIGVDVDASRLQHDEGLQSSFPSRLEASLYINNLPSLLQSKGYITASVDSLQLDSASGKAIVFLGDHYKWARLSTALANLPLLEAVHWNDKAFMGPVNFSSLQEGQKKILDYLEENGHPFGKVYLDSIAIRGEEVEAVLMINKGPQYKVDSIRVFGNVKINNSYLQHYLGITNGSLYNKKLLHGIAAKLRELTYLQEEKPSDLSLLGTGSVLNLYLKEKNSNQVNALIGFLPNSNQSSGSKKLLLTVDANILLRNALGSGETIGLVWQQLQKSSPRLNFIYEQPYLFQSPFGIAFSLDMYKKDSTFLNLNMNLGTTYKISNNQTGSVFLQRRQTILNGVNTARVMQTRLLPPEADVSSLNLGVSYTLNNTNYKFNPKKGNEFSFTATAGTKKIKKNAAILELKDPSDPGFKFDQLYDTVKLKVYQFRITTSAAHYIPLGQQSTFKLGINAGLYQSPSYYRNELFRIGGYHLLRGFDEESQFVSQYAIGTAEYRYLIGLNSAFFGFVDGGYGKHLQEANSSHTYLSTGVGLSFETKAGIINLAWAIGRRNDVEWNLRQSKLHLGFASFF
jgi:outer membrane protein assembly factor BamA